MIIHAQRHGDDCGVAALCSFLDVSYGDAYAAAYQVSPGFADNGGLSIDDMLKAARRFGVRLQRVHWRRVKLASDSGILWVNWTLDADRRKHGVEAHWVILSAGTIIDPGDLSYGLALKWLDENKGRAGTLLKEKDL